MTSQLQERGIGNEFVYSTSRSSGPGGQSVNKVNTKVEVRFHIDSSECLSENEKKIIHKKLENKISSEGFIILTSQEERSQIKNRSLAEQKMLLLIKNALKKKKKRIPTRPSRKSVEKRLNEKRITADKKATRKKPGL